MAFPLTGTARSSAGLTVAQPSVQTKITATRAWVRFPTFQRSSSGLTIWGLPSTSSTPANLNCIGRTAVAVRASATATTSHPATTGAWVAVQVTATMTKTAIATARASVAMAASVVTTKAVTASATTSVAAGARVGLPADPSGAAPSYVSATNSSQVKSSSSSAPIISSTSSSHIKSSSSSAPIISTTGGPL